ncbi:MAG: low molecular weight protein arginine phosphatase [bacterium]
MLFVCTGNLCRSPMAEGILRQLLEKAGLDDVRVSSAGTMGVEGEPAAPLAERVCKENGIDISGHVACRLTRDLLRVNDLIAVMELDHLQFVQDMLPEAASKTRMLSDFGQEKDRFLDIPDPYGRSRREYTACFLRLRPFVEKLLLHIQSQTGKPSAANRADPVREDTGSGSDRTTKGVP